MKRNILLILLLAILMVFGRYHADAQDSFIPYERAKLHPLICDKPAPDFFEGALLGNGAMGVVVTTRPDAVLFYFGHNNVWDIRIAENNREKIGTFKEVFQRVKAISDTFSVLIFLNSLKISTTVLSVTALRTCVEALKVETRLSP